MEFGRKQERPFHCLIESAAFESCFSERSETKEKTTDTLLKQYVLRLNFFHRQSHSIYTNIYLLVCFLPLSQPLFKISFSFNV